MEEKEQIKKVLESLDKIKAVEVEKDKGGLSFAVYVEHQPTKLGLWVDCWVEDGDILTDWNKYIFENKNELDQIQKELQEKAIIFELFTSEAICKLEQMGLIKQDKKGLWRGGKKWRA